MRARLMRTFIPTLAAVLVSLAPTAPADATVGRPPSGPVVQPAVVATVLIAPAVVVRAVPKVAAVAAPALPDPDDPASFVWPAKGPIWSPFGPRGGRNHDGVDIGAPNGSPIVAAQLGTVTLAGWKNGYGNTVVIDHGQGISTLYAHQSRLLVRVGAVVEQGTPIGFVGATGHVTAPHLHYEVHVNGVPRDPMPWL